MLLHVTTGGAPVFCKLQKVSDIEFLDGNELKVIKIGKTYYEYIPIKFSVSAFFQSLEAAIKVASEAEKAKKATEKSIIKRTKKATETTSKQIAKKAKELSEKYKDVPENILLQIAEDLLKKRRKPRRVYGIRSGSTPGHPQKYIIYLTRPAKRYLPM